MRRFLAVSLLSVLPVLMSSQASATLIDIVVIVTWESANVNATINPFGFVDGDRFVMKSTYDDSTFFNGSEGVTSDVDPGINPGTSLDIIIPHAGVAPNPLVFDESDHTSIGFAPNAQIEFDGPNAGSPGNFRNFEIHVDFNYAGDNMNFDQFMGGIQEETDMFNISQGGNLAAVGDGSGHIELVVNDVTANAGGPYVFNAGNLSVNLAGTSGGGNGFGKVFDWTGPGGTLSNSPGQNIALGLAESGLTNTIDTASVSLVATENFTDFASASSMATTSYANTAPVVLSASGTTEPDLSITFAATIDDVDLVANALVANFENLTLEFLYLGTPFLVGPGNIDLPGLVAIFGSLGTFEVEGRVTDLAGATDFQLFDVVVPEPGTFMLLSIALAVGLASGRERAA